MGMAAADVQGRLAASVGELDAVAPCFAPALDVPNGGLLCALPALLAVGLLDGVEGHLTLPKGYYGLDSLLLLLAFMALARLASIESLRYCAPGGVGQPPGVGSRPGSAHPARQDPAAGPRRATRAVERGPVRALDGRCA